MPHSAASDLGMHCLPMSNKEDARLIWVNTKFYFSCSQCRTILFLKTPFLIDCQETEDNQDIHWQCIDIGRHVLNHLSKLRVLSPLRSLRTCTWNEVDLVPLACEDGVKLKF